MIAASFAWQPWKDFRDEEGDLPIDRPPCPHCVFWRPRAERHIDGQSGRDVFDGVRLCHRDEMQYDFSCFTGAESCDE